MGFWKSNSFVELEGEGVHVKMGWGFDAKFERSSIRGVQPFEGIPGGIGVHGFRGRYLVNGAASGIVTMALEPVAKGHMIGIPVKISQLSVSLDEPQQFIAEVSAQLS
jgi:hypothetical protein